MEVQTRPNLLTVSQFIEKHQWATRGGLRQLLFERETNGLNVAVVRIGRKLLLDEDRFFAWVEKNGREAQPNV